MFINIIVLQFIVKPIKCVYEPELRYCNQIRKYNA